MRQLERLTREIAADLVEGPTVADLVMEERERVEQVEHVDADRWRSYQKLKIDCAATGIEAALLILAASVRGKTDPSELARLQHRLAVGWAKVERHQSAVLDHALRDLTDEAEH
jgi:hypothetical protein